MGKKHPILSDCLFSILVFFGTVVVNLLLQELFDTHTLVPMIFVLGVFLIAWRTRGYLYSICASVAGVLAVNYFFTTPYYAFDLISPECISSAIAMLIVSAITGTLTTQIKAQDKIKAEADKERMRSNLLRAVSHDLRTPLTTICGACSTLLENYDALAPQQHKKLLGDIHTDANWLIRMVENLLSVTRVDAESVRLAKQDTVLEELIGAVMAKFRNHHPMQPVQVQIPEEFISIPMDAMLIQQLLMNLLENAVFHATGMRNLSLTVEQHRDHVVFRVTDDGCGIRPELLPTLFTGTHSTDSSADRGRSNMGIGLSVCSAIVKAHGGRIWATNRPEGGAEISFTLDLEKNNHGE